MNGKRSKALMRLCEASTIGAPAVKHQWVKGGKEVTLANGDQVSVPYLQTVLMSGCTRKVYQRAKTRLKALGLHRQPIANMRKQLFPLTSYK